MKKLNLKEAPNTVAFTFGRFNPPTTGHEKLCDAVRKANPSDYKIYASQSQNPKKDPLQYAKKIAYMKLSFPKHKKNIVVSRARNVFEILVELNKYDNLIMVVGSDRVKEFEMLIKKYNGVEARHGYYKFDTVKVLSAGDRDPDAEGVTGMSASKMRAAAADSDFDSFKQGTPLNDTQAKKLYFDVRKSMGIREQLDLSDFEVLRDLYLSEQIWNVGDLIITNEGCGEIIRKGTNYVSIIDENNIIKKVWLHDIQIDEKKKDEKEAPKQVKQDPDIKKRPGTQPAKYYAKDAEGDKMSKATKQARARHFAKYGDRDPDSDANYKPAPGDAGGKTKPSKHTKKFKQMFGDETNPRIPRKKGQPAKSDKHSDLYTDEDPVGTIHGLKFATVQDAKDSVAKIERSDRTHAHKVQAAVAMEQRAKEMGKTQQAAVYRAYIEKMKKKTKRMQEFTDYMYEKAPDTEDAMKRYKAGKAGFTDIAHLKAKGLIKRADGTKRKSPKYEYYEIGTDNYVNYLRDITPGEEKRDEYKQEVSEEPLLNEWGETIEEAEYQGRKVKLNNPVRGGSKKFYVYVRNEKGNVVKVSFGDATGMDIKRDDPERRKSFRARHNCDNPGPKTKARYWSCKFWEKGKTVTDLMKG